MLDRNILNWLKNKSPLRGLKISQQHFQPENWRVLPGQISHCGHVGGIISQKDASQSVFLSSHVLK